MESSENPADAVHSGPRDQSSAPKPTTTRGRKRHRNNLTTPVGGDVFRDISKDWYIDFKKSRCSPPVGGTDFRVRSNDRFIFFKKPRLPKRRRRTKNLKSGGNAPAAADVSVRTMTTPTASLTPPSPPSAPPTRSVVGSKAWADYDEEDDRRVYEEDPATLFPETDPPPSHCAPDDPLPHLDSALPPLDSGVTTVDPPVPDFSVAEREKEEEEESSLSEKLKEISRSLLSMWKDEYMDVLDRGKAKERIVQLLRREDETSREQDSEEHLQKKKKNLIDLFRDIEESGKSRQSRFWGFEIFGPIFQRPTLFCETQDVAVARFLFLRDEDGLREETRRLRRYQTLLEQWNEAFTREEHDVSLWVGECLKDVLAEVHKDISYLTRVGRLQPQCLPSKNCMSLSAYRKMKKRIMERLRLNVDELRRRETYSQYLLVLSFKNYDKLPALSTTGRFYQSSGGKTSRSLSVRNTRKYLRRLHTRTAGGALRRGRRRLADVGLKLCSQVTHGSGLSVNPADRNNLNTSRVSHSQILTLN